MSVCDPRGWELRLLDGCVELRVIEEGVCVRARLLTPIDAAMMSVELAEASAAAAAGKRAYATREQRIATIEAARGRGFVPPGAVIESFHVHVEDGAIVHLGDIGAGPIGSPPLPPSGPSSRSRVEAHPGEVGAERSIRSHATNRRRKR